MATKRRRAVFVQTIADMFARYTGADDGAVEAVCAQVRAAFGAVQR